MTVEIPVSVLAGVVPTLVAAGYGLIRLGMWIVRSIRSAKHDAVNAMAAPLADLHESKVDRREYEAHRQEYERRFAKLERATHLNGHAHE